MWNEEGLGKTRCSCYHDRTKTAPVALNNSSNNSTTRVLMTFASNVFRLFMTTNVMHSQTSRLQSSSRTWGVHFAGFMQWCLFGGIFWYHCPDRSQIGPSVRVFLWSLLRSLLKPSLLPRPLNFAHYAFTDASVGTFLVGEDQWSLLHSSAQFFTICRIKKTFKFICFLLSTPGETNHTLDSLPNLCLR